MESQTSSSADDRRSRFQREHGVHTCDREGCDRLILPYVTTCCVCAYNARPDEEADA